MRITHQVLLFCLISSSHVWAKITISSISGVSRVDLSDPTQPKFYGSLDLACTGSAAAAPSACNPSSLATAPNIGLNTPITIAFTSDTATSGTAAAMLGTTGTSSSLTVTNPTIVSAKNQTATLSFTWSSLCSAASGAGGTGNCATGQTGFTNANLQIGISAGNTPNQLAANDDKISVTFGFFSQSGNNTIDDCTGTSSGGICNFWAFPGDGGTYIKDISQNAAYPNSNGAQIIGFQVYISNSTFNNTKPTIADREVFVSVDQQGNYNQFIDGLQNNPANAYYVRLAMVDQAGNIFNFISDTNIQDAKFGNCANGKDFPSASSPAYDGCRYKVAPDQVIGILAKDLNCFIATAAYGSKLEPKLNVFRKFRNEFLLQSDVGKKIVRSYYDWGPPLARRIAESETARAIVRTFLWPAYWFASASLAWGLKLTLAIFLGGLLFLSTLIVRLRNRRAKHT